MEQPAGTLTLLRQRVEKFDGLVRLFDVVGNVALAEVFFYLWRRLQPALHAAAENNDVRVVRQHIFQVGYLDAGVMVGACECPIPLNGAAGPDFAILEGERLTGDADLDPSPRDVGNHRLSVAHDHRVAKATATGKLTFRLGSQRTQRLAHLAQVIGRVSHDANGAADLPFVFPGWGFLDKFQNALVAGP